MFAVYFLLFVKTMKWLNTEDRKRYETLGSPLSIALSIVPSVSVFMVQELGVQTGLAVFALALAQWENHRHQQRLRHLGFPPRFLHRLRKISPLASVATFLIFAGVLLEKWLKV